MVESLFFFWFSCFFEEDLLSFSFILHYFSSFQINFHLSIYKKLSVGSDYFFLNWGRLNLGLALKNLFDVIYLYIFQVRTKCIFNSMMKRCKLYTKNVRSKKHLLLWCPFSFVFGHWPTSFYG